MTCDFFKLAAPGVQALHPYQPGKPLEELEREYGITNAIKLASNENPLGASPLALEAIQTHLTELARYPDGNGFYLKQALSHKYAIDFNQITLGNGSNDVLELIARAFVTSANSVIFSEYAFAIYSIITQAIGAKAIITPAKQWGHDLAAMQAAINADTKVIFIANPNNPTGTFVDKISLKAFLMAVPDNVMVVLDEAYYEYIDNPNYPNGLELLRDHANVIVCRTFSKAYGLAGLRVGYAIAHPDVTNLLNRVRQPFNINSLALIAATAALKDTAHLAKTIDLNKVGMQQVTRAFTAMNLNYIDSVGNFVSVNVNDGAKVYELLLRAGVIVRPMGGYNMPHHLRITIGLAQENERFISALANSLAVDYH